MPTQTESLDMLRARLAALAIDNRVLSEALDTAARLHATDADDLARLQASAALATDHQGDPVRRAAQASARTTERLADLRASEVALALSRAETKVGVADLLASELALASSQAETKVGVADLLASELALASSRAETKLGAADLLASAVALESSQAETKVGVADLLASELALASSRAETKLGAADLLASAVALESSRAETKLGVADLLASAVALASSQAETKLGVADLLASTVALASSRAETQLSLADLLASAVALASSQAETKVSLADLLASEVANRALSLANALLVTHEAALEKLVEKHTAALMREVEERRRAEEALRQGEKLQAIGQLTGGIAHDFNNLLTVISGNLHFVAEIGKSNERLRRLAGTMQRAVDRGARLTGQLLAFARRQPLMPEVLQLDQMIGEFSTLVQRALGETIRLDIEAERGLWACEIDSAQFESAVLNLTINARDAMPNGGRLGIAARNLRHPGGDALAAGRYVAICVEDSGHGMTAEVLAHAVEPFFTTKEVGKGSGLGLSQVYGFVQQSGGGLRIDSRPGEGTRITMLFPFTSAVLSLAAAHPVAPPLVDQRSAQVLVVEDDLELLDLVMETLTDAGLKVFGAHDGAEALALLRDHPGVRLMLSDVVMPNGTSGVELGREAQSRYPDLRVLLMSGYPRDELSRFGGTATFPFLSKPFRPAELVERLDRMLNTAM